MHSKSESYSEEDLEAEVPHNWFEHFGLEFHKVHSSGHCSGKKIEETVKAIGPKVLFPVHTEHPEMFDGLTEKVRGRIKVGRAYEI